MLTSAYNGHENKNNRNNDKSDWYSTAVAKNRLNCFIKVKNMYYTNCRSIRNI